MARPTSNRPLNTHEVRTKIPRTTARKIEEAARAEGLRSTDIVRRLLMNTYPEKEAAK